VSTLALDSKCREKSFSRKCIPNPIQRYAILAGTFQNGSLPA
jgi:hypothetical protein